jgi:hypothetical protein
MSKTRFEGVAPMSGRPSGRPPFRWKISNPLLIAATAVVGLIAYPILQPAWVMIK